MIQKTLTLLSICAYGSGAMYQQPQYAMSSQRYHRSDVPLSYQFSAVHDYYRPRKAADYGYYQYTPKTNYHTIQYAPLDAKPNKQSYQSVKQKYQDTATGPNLPSYEQKYYTTEENLKGHLEPTFVSEDLNNQNYQSYITVHNTEELPLKEQPLEKTIYKIEDQFQKSLVPVSKYVYPQKPKQDLVTQNAIKKTPSPIAPQNQFAFGYLPYEDQPKSLHEQLAFEKSQTVYQRVPRLHLNIARSYNIANMPQKALQEPNIHRYARFTQTYLIPNTEPMKTKLFPDN